MVGDTLEDVLETTCGALDLLLLPEVGPETRELVEGHAAAGTRAVAFTAGGVAHPLELATVVGEGVTVAREVERLGADTLLVGGALTQEFVDDFTRVLPPRTELRVIVRDATVLVLPPAMVGRFLRRGIRLQVAHTAAGARPHREPVPRTAAVPAQGLLLRGRRGSRRPRPHVRRRERVRPAAGGQRRGSRAKPSPP